MTIPTDLTFTPPPRVSATNPTESERRAHRAYLKDLFAAVREQAAHLKAVGLFTEADRRAINAAAKDLAPRRRVTVREESLIIGDFQRLLERLTRSVGAAGTPVVLLDKARRQSTQPAATLTQPTSVTLKQVEQLAELAELMLSGTLDAAGWVAACTPQTVRTAQPLSLGMLADMHTSLKEHQRTHVAYVKARLDEPDSDPHETMRRITGRTHLTKCDYQRITVWEATPHFENRCVGQRTTYRLVPLYQALAVHVFISRRGASVAAIYREVDRLARKLATTALAAGAPYRFVDSTPECEPHVQTELSLAGESTGVCLLTLPTLQTFRRFIRALPQVLHTAREAGIEHVRRLLRPVDAIWRAQMPNECWQTDAWELPVYAAHSADDAEAPNRKPWAVVMLDEYSGYILGYHLSRRAPNATTVGYALYNAVTPQPRLGRVYAGLPQALRMDRGTEFVNRRIEGLLDGLSIRMEVCRPHRPDDKAVVERVFDTLGDRMSADPGFSMAPGTHRSRLEWDTSGRVMSWTELVQRFEAHVVSYNTTPNSETGLSPLERWDHRTLRHAPQSDDLVQRLMWTDTVVTLTTKGVRCKNHFYVGTLSHPDGRTHLELIGTRVRLYFIPGLVGEVHAFTAHAETMTPRPELYLGVMYAAREGVARLDLHAAFQKPYATLKHTIQKVKASADSARLDQVRTLSLPAPQTEPLTPHGDAPPTQATTAPLTGPVSDGTSREAEAQRSEIRRRVLEAQRRKAGF